MKPVYEKMQALARTIAKKFPAPLFYRDFAGQVSESREFFASDPIILELADRVRKMTDNDLGHGMDHVTKVTVDAGALVLIEAGRRGIASGRVARCLLLAQCAGLLHDIRRKEKDHAQRGAEEARKILTGGPLEKVEVEEVAAAIANHEAFKEEGPVDGPEGGLLSDCLYDADKFRWGPDNFTETVWHMIDYFSAPLSVFIERYPEGVRGIERIRDTFRTETGREYGPDFIDLGMAIGKEIYLAMSQEEDGLA